MTILERTLSTLKEGGGNLKGEVDGAPWIYALPEEVRRVLWVGPAGLFEADLAALKRRAVCRHVADDSALDHGSRYDLVVATAGDPDRLVDRLAPGGTVVDLTAGRQEGVWRLDYEGGRLRAVAPAGRTNDHLARQLAASGQSRLRDRVRRLRSPGRYRWTTRTAALLGGTSPTSPPDWVVEMAGTAGLDVASHGWSLWCRGDYASQKLVMFLYPPGRQEPDVVVKIIRDPRFNHRLANEARVLRHLERLGGFAGRVPRVLFDGCHHGSVVCAEAVVAGVPMRQAIQGLRAGEAECLVDDAAGLLERLGSATAVPTDASDLAGAIQVVVDRFASVFGDIDAARALEKAVQVLAGTGTLPVVVQHGDPGTWNAVVDEDGRAGFLDWEAAETAGVPLWDVVYMLRSAVLALDRPVRRSRIQALRRHLVSGSDRTPLVARLVRRAADRCSVPREAIEPLVLTCWMHRAVKEATRLPAGEAHRSQYYSLLRASLSGRNEPGFRMIAEGG